ncbi:hypothetical protein MtrunA17_Chr3g0077751 [Medicago truncatula]|uniref:Transmembrane protein n=1 Tax=Medicago truncatula TaxID=3880 RepID=A0A396IKH8_MEDTR|nr:hypothetical protein MtrunA17_Chr3g0077751 [Medicago truncatula]
MVEAMEDINSMVTSTFYGRYGIRIYTLFKLVLSLNVCHKIVSALFMCSTYEIQALRY